MSDCARCSFQDFMRDNHGDWDNVAYYVKEYKKYEFGHVKLMDSFFDPTPGDGYGYYGDNCHPQGHEGDVFMVFQDGDKFFKVFGTSNSYGNCQWSIVKEVFGTPVEKIVYEFKEA